MLGVSMIGGAIIAAVYGAEAEIYPNMGHDMMLEPGWAAVAERIHRWLEARHRVSDVGRAST